MKRFLFSLAMMASMLNAPPKIMYICWNLEEEIEEFTAMERAQDALTDRQFIVFMHEHEETIRHLVTRINTLLNTHPDNTMISSFIPSRDHLQTLIDIVQDQYFLMRLSPKDT